MKPDAMRTSVWVKATDSRKDSRPRGPRGAAQEASGLLPRHERRRGIRHPRGPARHGIRVPEDVSLVGFDDVPLPTLHGLELTTMRIPVEEMSAACVRILDTYRDGGGQR